MSTDQHHFVVEVAEQYGINAAIVLNGLHFWCVHNRANGTSFHDGNWWTYNSVKAMRELFPYFTENQIYKALKDLESAGLIISGNYNNVPYDRTKWYALTDEGYSFYGECITVKTASHFDSNENRKLSESEPIPVEETVIENNKEKLDKKKTKKFVKPTVEEIQNYIKEKGYCVDAQTFYDYYESVGWMRGKTPMKDWRATIRTWQRREKSIKTGFDWSKENEYIRSIGF